MPKEIKAIVHNLTAPDSKGLQICIICREQFKYTSVTKLRGPLVGLVAFNLNKDFTLGSSYIVNSIEEEECSCIKPPFPKFIIFYDRFSDKTYKGKVLRGPYLVWDTRWTLVELSEGIAFITEESIRERIY